MSETKTSADLRREITERDRELIAKRNQLKSIYDATKNEQGEMVPTPQQAEQIRALEPQCATLTQQVNALKMAFMEANNAEELDRRANDTLGGPGIFEGAGGQGIAPEASKATRPPASLGEAFVESAGYKKWVHGGQSQQAHLDVQGPLGFRGYAMKAAADALKATFLSTTGPFTSIEKVPGVVELGTQMFTVADLFSQAQTANTTIRYIQEDTLTNYAVEVAEEGQKPEASWDMSEVDATIKKIAVIARVTDELFMDYPAVRDYVNDRLPWMVRQREETQLLNGTGSSTDIQGVLGTSGVLTQAKGAFSNVDAIYLGITKVRTQGFFEPDAIVIDPTNWTPIRLLKTTTGEYVWGAPSVMGPESIFGKRVVVTANMVDNTALVGAFRIGGTVYYRQGLRIEATNSDASDFQYNRIALRAEQRETLVIWRPKAFCKVTGLDSA